jgi:hypothetical protein
MSEITIKGTIYTLSGGETEIFNQLRNMGMPETAAIKTVLTARKTVKKTEEKTAEKTAKKAYRMAGKFLAKYGKEFCQKFAVELEVAAKLG